MIPLEELCDPEWAEWYRMTPQQRWAAQEQLWEIFLALGGSLEPEPDTQSPFYDPDAPCPSAPGLWADRGVDALPYVDALRNEWTR